MMVVIGHSLRLIGSSDDGEDREDENDEETEQRKLSEDDEPGWVMGATSKTFQHRMEILRQKPIKFDELTEPGWGDSADYLRERDTKYGSTELRIPVVVILETDHDVAAPALEPFGELMECFDIVPGRSQMVQRRS